MTSLTTYESNPQLLRETFGHFPCGVAALSAEVDGTREVLVASSFTVGVSMEPPLVMFAVQNSSTTWPTLRRASSIGISVLAEEHGGLCRQLASKDKANRFTGVAAHTTGAGAVLVADSSVSLECRIHAEYPAGDHTVVLFEVTALHADRAIEPLVFHGSRFRTLEADAA
jgi:flavin reductase (DIM6/NTAB) family NADH-FMN oxidoreductase RutF